MKFLYFLMLLGVVSAKTLPSYLELCPKSVKEAGPCIMKNVKIIQPKMEKGIPELLIPALNPLDITKADLNTGPFSAVFTNAKMFNLHNFDLKNVKLNLDTLDLEITINFPKMDVTSDYAVNGKILILQVNSKGKSHGNFTNLDADITGKLSLIDRKGKKHLKVDKTNIELKIQDAKLTFDNLFGDNKELNDNANKVLNDNIHDVLNEFMPVTKEVVSGIVMGITNNIFAKFSFDELFP